MTPERHAFIQMQLALSGWRAARDAEAQVAHWLTEELASHSDLREARKRTAAACLTHRSARKRYLKLSSKKR